MVIPKDNAVGLNVCAGVLRSVRYSWKNIVSRLNISRALGCVKCDVNTSGGVVSSAVCKNASLVRDSCAYHLTTKG